MAIISENWHMARPKRTPQDDPITREDSPAPRRKGRPALSIGVGRMSIIEATVEALRKTSPASITVKEIAGQAGVDAALIRYYFGDRDGLLRETVAHMLSQRQAASQAAVNKDLAPEERLRERIRTVLALQRIDPNFHRLVVEQLFSANDEHSREMVESIAARGLAIEGGLLNDGKDTLRPVDARFLNVCILGMCEFFASSQPLVAAMFGKPVDDRMTQAYVDFLVDLLMKGLAHRVPTQAPLAKRRQSRVRATR